MIEHSQYHCPKCSKSLTNDKKVILHFKRSPADDFSDIFLAPEPGNYEFYTVPATNFQKEISGVLLPKMSCRPYKQKG